MRGMIESGRHQAVLDFLLGGAGFSLPVLDLTLFTTVVVSPFAEEWALRGFYMREQMERGATLASAGKNAAFVFVLMHLPANCVDGWMETWTVRVLPC